MPRPRRGRAAARRRRGRRPAGSRTANRRGSGSTPLAMAGNATRTVAAGAEGRDRAARGRRRATRRGTASCTAARSGPRHRRARKFARFGAGSMIAFPPTVIFGEGRIAIGAGTTIGPLASISAGMPSQAGLRGDPVITIGDRCTLGKGIGIVGHERIEIGDDIWTGHYVYVTDQNHGYEDLDLPIGTQMWTQRAGVDRRRQLARPRRGRAARLADRRARRRSRRRGRRRHRGARLLGRRRRPRARRAPATYGGSGWVTVPASAKLTGYWRFARCGGGSPARRVVSGAGSGTSVVDRDRALRIEQASGSVGHSLGRYRLPPST